MSQQYDPTDLRGQERSKAEELAERRDEARKEVEDLKHVMGQKLGRRFIWRLLSEARIYHDGFDPNALQMARNAGRKEYGMKLRLQIEAICPELYDKMRNEAIKNVRNTDDGNADHTN